MRNLDEIKTEIEVIKESINILKEKKESLENELLSLCSGDVLEGTETLVGQKFVAKISHKLKRKLDYEKYQALELPENLQFVDLKPTINLKKLRHIEAVDPAMISRCVTTSPAKPVIKFVERKEAT